MLMTVQNGNRGEICYAIHRYAKANNKYMKNYNKNIELSCLMYRFKQFVWMGHVSTITCK